ncbi:MAG: PilZ domain-containing protein [Desulfobulbaceae bacterium]|nr:PilZ domain-containing protein [Desulfobulbaceae bacterium]
MKMTASQEEITKIYVTPSGVAIIKCPDCEMIRTLTVDKFRGTKHILNIKCSCKRLFRVKLEFRKFYRKKAELSGDYVLLPEKIHRGRLMVVNISQGGVGVHILGTHRLSAGQEIQICFTLDDKHGSVIDRRAVVRVVSKNNVCCEFKGNGSSHDKALGFYLMV